MNNILSPSLLSIDFNNIEKNANVLDNAGVKWYHLDVMDGAFVPNISFGPPVIKAIRKVTDAFFDVHLMINEPKRYIDAFKDAGADILTVHYEACEDLDDTISLIREAGLKCGLAINPETDTEVVKPYIDKVDMILVMSVHPGFGGQKFMPAAIEKLKKVKEWSKEINPDLLIEVDGGINFDNVSTVLDAGANVIVAGSACFNGDIAENVSRFFEVLG
ncbi:MAG: ribulose-phosphate 3-epimerase [Lachnospiraceae bacterium]|nr:ribulose-phosphate 3-epimerase [Lachnospiraceae bacterium]